MTGVPHLLESTWSRIGRWAAAALVVGGLHAGGLVLALMHQPEEAWDVPAGGVNVDMLAPPAPMPLKQEDKLAIGPEAEQGKEAAEAAKQVVQKVEKDDPLVEPSPAPNPEVVLPKPRPEEKEQPKEEAQEAAEKKVAQEEGQERRTAPPPVEAPPTRSAAPSPTPSPSLARAKALWEKALFRQIERHRIDPSSTKWSGMKGRAVVRFKLDETGSLISSEIVQSAGSPLLDDAALRLLKRASPFPRPPPGVELDYTMRIALEH